MMMLRLCSIITIFLLLNSFLSFSQTPSGHPSASAAVSSVAANRNNLSFVPNQGQWDTQVKYKADLPDGSVFLTDKGFVYHYVSGEDMRRIDALTDEGKDINNEVIHHHAYKVNFLGARSAVNYMPSEKRSRYNNYFLGNDKSKWAGGVPLFGKVIQKGIYNGIDVSVDSKGNTMKYDFIVAPHADPSQIRLSFDGVTPQVTEDGDLLIRTSVNEVVERAPYSYQIISGEQMVVPSAYHLEGGVLSFVFPKGYNEHYPLIIDPTLVFATYSSATGGGFFSYSTTYDQHGNLYAGAAASGATVGWPVSTGAFQTNPGGGSWDVTINKYNSLGTAILYSTYYGGSAEEYPNTMIVNGRDELIVVGNTRSSNLPVTTGCYDSTFNGGYNTLQGGDIFVAHFNSTGTALIGATYIGGSGSDPVPFSITGASSINNQNTTSPINVNFDKNGNIWVVSNTASTDFPVTANAHQSTYKGGSADAVIFQLNPDCSQLLYSTYMGGAGADALYDVGFINDNLVVCGFSESTDFPTTSGVLHELPIGGKDGVVTIIDPDNGQILHSTYLGTGDFDAADRLQVSVDGYIYIMGETQGSYPISGGVYSISKGNVFIDKLSSDLSTSALSTIVGGGSYLPDGFLVDVCNNVYVTGFDAPNGLPTTSDAYPAQPNSSFWFCVLKPNFSDLLYGSYFGSGSADHTHVGVSRLDPNGVVYHSLCSNSITFSTTPGVVGPKRANSGQDVVSFKFDFELDRVKAQIKPLSNSIHIACAPYTIHLDNASSARHDDLNFFWDAGDGSPRTNDTLFTHTYDTAGLYVITLHANSDSSCAADDYDTFTLIINPVYNDTLIDAVCQGESYAFAGQMLNSPGVYTDSQRTDAGCDSITTLYLTVNPSYHDVLRDTIRQGERYDFFGRMLTSAGVYVDSQKTYLGCDSVISLYLSVLPSSAINKLDFAQGIALYPNPNEGKMTLHSDKVLNDASIHIVDILGQTVMRQEHLFGNDFKLDINSYAGAGIYYLEIRESGMVERIKFTKR